MFLTVSLYDIKLFKCLLDYWIVLGGLNISVLTVCGQKG
jgi:hypothetical protein